MKTRLFCTVLLTCLLLVLASCHDHPTSPSSPTPEGPHVRGKVTNWLMGDTMVAVAQYQRYPYTSAESIYVFGTSAVAKDGSFYVPLSLPPKEALDVYLDNSNTPNDTAANFVQVYGLALRNPDRSYSQRFLLNASVPYDTFYSDSSKPGDFLASLVYVDRDVEITGSYQLGNPSTGGWIQYHNHLECKKGWNRIVNTIVSNQAHQIAVEATILNTETGNWYVE